MTVLELLDAEQICSALTHVARQQLTQLEILASIDSTNAYLLNKKTLSTGHVCLAEQQTAGRGRRNKPWYSPVGKNIYLSLGWHFANSKQLSGLSIAVGVAIANALINYGLPTIDLKWPNDIWYQQQKLGGILVEITRESTNDYRTIIGVGINVDTPKENNAIDQPWIDIATITQHIPQRNLLVSCILNELLTTLLLFQTQGLLPFLPQWKKFDCLLNRPITINGPHGQLAAMAVGIDQQGNLLAKVDDNIQPIASGEVSVRPLR